MVGGTVVEVLPCEVRGESRLWINVRDKREGECAIFVKATPAARSVSEGDRLWWQGPWAFWTPRKRPFSDMRLERIGFSGVRRPASHGGSAPAEDEPTEEKS